VLTQIINNDDSVQKVRGALQGLMIFATFYKDQTSSFEGLNSERLLQFLQNKDTQLEASYLLARVSLLNQGNISEFLQVMPELAPAAKANLVRALAKTQQRQVLPTLLTRMESEHIGVRVNAIRSLVNYSDNPVATAGVMQALTFDDVISQVTALQSIQADWFNEKELLAQVQNKLKHDHSWVQSEAMSALVRGEQGNKSLTEQWLQSDDPNHQRAAIAYFVEEKDPSRLEKVAKSDKPIIANGAKQALNPEPEKPEEPSQTGDALPELPVLIKLETTKGDITIKLFADTPYTSLNFIELVESGFYDNTYFHRVIPNFVAQGGSKVGDGSGNIDYSIREELSYRSHLPGTVGMATLGKDTGGAQFFINTAPNLHLDSNYTIFGEVVDGMGAAIQLEQNDRVLKANLVDN
jgi:cyclophilin family peptidyl-prolyl cis-trans isomerase